MNLSGKLVAALAVALCVPAASAFAGTIAGTVKLEGKAPAPVIIKVNAQVYCVPFHPNGLKGESVVVGTGNGLANVIVYLKGATGGAAKTDPVELHQKGCQYIPHVVALQTGETLKIMNDDDTMHNIHPNPKLNAHFNKSQPHKGMVNEVKFDKEEIIPVKCDVHGWMSAYIGVFGSPFFAVTDENGNFKIEGVPAGSYEIEAWHEKYKTMNQKVTVDAGEKKVNFSFAAKG